MEERILKPGDIVRELNKYIVGQDDAKRAVAIALRNRWRRQKVKGPIKEEIYPNNIIMIGPTGVGKTEIARRLARIEDAPFVKVEATRYTEVGYVGRDVESMVRDLMNSAVGMVKAVKMKEIEKKAEILAEDKVIDLIMRKEGYSEGREGVRKMLKENKLDNMKVELQIEKKPMPMVEVLGGAGLEEIQMSLQDTLSNLFSGSKKKKYVSVKEALEIFKNEEANKLIDMDEVVEEAKKKVENNGIIFIDEIDKVAGGEAKSGPDVSRMGVQRDLLPIVEGTDIMTKYGIVKSHHILFIAAGAFNVHKPSDLIPELQGRFPIRVELSSLTEKDFERILVEPENALVKQYQALFETEGIDLKFTPDAIKSIAHFSAEANRISEDIGARRLSTVLTAVLDDLLFKIPDVKNKNIVIDGKYVEEKISSIIKNEDLTRYI
ncbi:ATP-dependent protease ATPase subunit HslU, partial [candidate division WOR-3 bacterium]|nr:ATP-dependent protease ATPase subunit HslU [candidate division WOR-3 bacterium]